MNGMTRRERQIFDIDKILEILDKSKVLYLASVVGIIKIDVLDFTAKHRPAPSK